ncbi:CidA/LrgA family protein [Alkalicoccus daliensis]|uniref:Holin-like protein n=1 Tax=Alkalicoccus daliensis TaxID=745820 RepID=A0A1G9ZNW1_9BACI|nr:CidA/LrgA family protein [Alkalicoccus daliensis]SDN22787.1 holin-like protein [Alkalicoccus daliensis]
MLKQVFIFIFQLCLLWSIYYAGVLLSHQFNLILPGNVTGMVMLFILLYFKILPFKWVEKTGTFAVKHLGLLFIPFCAGVVLLDGITGQSLLLLLMIITLSTIIGILTAGKSFQWLHKKGEV